MLNTSAVRGFLLIFTVVIALFFASPQRLHAEPARATDRRILLYYYLSNQTVFQWTWEESYAPGHRGLSEMARLPIVPPPAGSTVRRAVQLLRPQIPNVKIWQDAVNKRVVHFADHGVLAWVKYPLDTKLTFHGTMSLLQLDDKVLRKLLPHTDFEYACESPPGPENTPLIPHLKILKVQTRFNVKAISLRRFLTDVLPYRGDPDKGGELWEANAYQGISGKFKGRVSVYVMATPMIVPAATRPSPAAEKTPAQKTILGK